ncbi:MAG: MBL fold metallo-hydrolase, partial [Clostridia bacterium]|nr:MBL fold metallo-hydrolase [Clostridia bacterium]
ILEPAFLFGGYPPDKLRHKFLMAQESDALPLTADSLPHGWELIPLPGHSFDMVGFRTESDTVYLADSLSSVQTLDKYGVGFIYDVAEYIRTLERIMDMQAAMFVPSHAEPTDNIAPLAEYNLKKVLEIAERVRKLCAEPICFDSLLTRLFDAYSMTMTVEQYALVGSTLRSYLAYLTDKGEVETVIQDNSLMWKKA